MIVDCFGGPGGWDVGAEALGLRPVGIEWGAAECATRAAAGHLTIRADVATYPAEVFAGRCEGLILSTPCPDFSSAGKRAGLEGETGGLVFEVLRWTRAVRPRWLACENVPEVAPIFRSFRAELAALGYSVWVGVLDAADYGVPQNRRRAFLLASLDRRAVPPAPTHAKAPHADLFGGPALLPWVSMAEALGWGVDGRIVETQNGSAAPSGNYFDPFAKPSRTICGARTPRWLYEDGDGTHGAILRTGNNTENGAGRERYERSVHRPAPTVDGKAGRSNWKLRHPGRSYDAEPAVRPVAEPAPTVALGHNLAGWCWERPATCVQGTPRLAPPGYRTGKQRAFDMDAGAVAVELWELGVLQGFPADYPWQGNKTERARQISNAVCPPMAAHLLAALTGREVTSECLSAIASGRSVDERSLNIA